MRILALLLIASCIAGARADEGQVKPDSPSGRLSGSAFMGRSTQEMQRDDSLNPGMLWVQEGEALWSRPAGRSNQSCAGCHGDARESMRGVAARYPVFDAGHNGLLNLGQRINQCRQKHQQAPALPLQGDELLGLESYVALQSRGMPLAASEDPRLQPFQARGEARWYQRMGQLNLSCAQCHDDNWGKRLGGSIIPQAHVGSYPVYRLEWQAMGSLQRRLRNCMSGVRAESFAPGAQELVELELYLARRSRGMTMEAPGVRP